MRDVVSVVSGAVVALGLLLLTSLVLNNVTGRPLGAAAFLLLALVLFPLCVAVALRITRPKTSAPSQD